MKDVDLDKARYKPVWRCIYCGWDANPKKLSKEHILAFAFGGKAVLPRASCRRCADETGHFERYCGRTIFGPLRIIYGYPTQHPDERPLTLPLEITRKGEKETREVAIEDYPAVPMNILSWWSPAILNNRSRRTEFDGLKPNIIMPPVKEQESKLRRLGAFDGASVTMPLRFDAVQFSRFIAKLVHALAVAEYGLGSFRPYLTDLIRGLDECPGNLIGGADGVFARDDLPGVQDHEGQIGLFRIGAKTFLCAKIRLFGFLGLPTYVAVIGEPSPELERQLTPN
jgi:hypothetical protein